MFFFRKIICALTAIILLTASVSCESKTGVETSETVSVAQKTDEPGTASAGETESEPISSDKASEPADGSVPDLLSDYETVPDTTYAASPETTENGVTSADPSVSESPATTTAEPVTAPAETTAGPDPEEPEFVPIISELPADSTELSKNLALRLAGFCDINGRDSLKKYMKSFSFEYVTSGNYDKSESDRSHTSAFMVGKREYGGRSYYLIVIRSTNKGEWYSNFDFAPSHSNDTEYAENFYGAALDIFGAVKGRLDSDPNKTVIVCGHSRGASTANLLGVMLDELYGEGNIYVYTYATPTTVRAGAANKRYGNIFNFINQNDIVTYLPPEQYGYSRAGQDILLASGSSVSSALTFFETLYGLAPDINSYYEVRYSTEGSGTSPDGMSIYDVMCIFAGYLAYGNLDIPDFSFSFLLSDLFPVFLNMASVFVSSDVDIASEHRVDKYIELISALNM